MSLSSKQLDLFFDMPTSESHVLMRIADLQDELDRTRKRAFARITDLTSLVSDLQARMMYLEGQLSLQCCTSAPSLVSIST